MDIVLLLEGIFLLGCIMHCYTDLKEMLLYDEVSFILLLTGCVYSILATSIGYGLLGSLATGGAFLALYCFCPTGIGFGDVKLAFVLGCWLGWQKGLLSLLIALWLGFIVGMLLLVNKAKGAKEAIPFGPFMCLSGIAMLYYGEKILQWYCSLF